MSTETITQLKKSFLFCGLPDNALQTLAEKISSQSLKQGEVLFSKGDAGNSLFMIDEGFLNITTEDKQGDTLILNQCGPGETIGEMSLLDKEPRSASVIAKTNAHILELKQDAFFDLLKDNPETALLLIRSFSSRLRFANTYVEKAIEWSGRIATGDYSLAMQEIQKSQSATEESAISDEAKAGHLLAAFFQMIENVKARENELKQQIKKLNFEIDQARRKEEFEELTSSEFYTDLKSQAQNLRQQRVDRAKKYAAKNQEAK